MNGGVLSKREDKGIDGGVFGGKRVDKWNVFRITRTIMVKHSDLKMVGVKIWWLCMVALFVLGGGLVIIASLSLCVLDLFVYMK